MEGVSGVLLSYRHEGYCGNERGVDSSVTAYLLKKQGHEVEGVSFILYEARMKDTFSGCCSMESIRDAGETAARLGVEHTAVDLRDEFMSRVIEPFIDAYARGITPIHVFSATSTSSFLIF